MNRLKIRCKKFEVIFEGTRLKELILYSGNKYKFENGGISVVYPNEKINLEDIEIKNNYIKKITDEFYFIGIETWLGEGILEVKIIDNEFIEIVPSIKSKRGKIKAVLWEIGGLKNFDIYVPFSQGIRLNHQIPVDKLYFQWPFQWEFPIVNCSYKNENISIFCPENSFKFKVFSYEKNTTGITVGIGIENFGPLDNKYSCGGTSYYLTAYKGPSKEIFEYYRKKFYPIKKVLKPEIKDRIKFAVSWCPVNYEILQFLKKIFKPQEVLIHLSDWRKYPYDSFYPVYQPNKEAKLFIEKAKKEGFNIFPHFNFLCCDQKLPVMSELENFICKNVNTGQTFGWAFNKKKFTSLTNQPYTSSSSWGIIPDLCFPVSQSSVEKIIKKGEISMAYIHQGLTKWREILLEEISRNIKMLKLNGVFLDQTLLTENLANCFVENLTPMEGMLKIEENLYKYFPDVMIAGEGLNELTSIYQTFGQVHLPFSNFKNAEFLSNVTAKINKYIYRDDVKMLGYGNLDGKTEESILRMKMHALQGALPTITVLSPDEILNPVRPVKEEIERAKG